MQEKRDSYYWVTKQSTRWNDNDVYGHINNVAYYGYFDTVANLYLIERAGLDILKSETIAYVVASNCEYYSPIAYPDKIDVGFRVDSLGSSSVHYAMAVFKHDQDLAAACGRFTHVFVSRESGKPIAIPETIRQALELAIV